MKQERSGLLMTALAGLMMVSMGCKTPAVGLDGDALKPCPKSPNCVSSMAEDAKHYIAPFSHAGERDQARERLIAILENTKRARIVTQTDDYLHAEFTSLVFRFTDDVEFYFDEKEPLIHVRSASRVGYSDLGANRKRVEALRQRFEK
ncbi:MAG: DUF1499 domain-containing protein [Desulfococcus multivorans]|nr:DUF1499 domain-containing protein [Desulfococcus multivorans]